jgi:hypothetical protein
MRMTTDNNLLTTRKLSPKRQLMWSQLPDMYRGAQLVIYLPSLI